MLACTYKVCLDMQGKTAALTCGPAILSQITTTEQWSDDGTTHVCTSYIIILLQCLESETAAYWQRNFMQQTDLATSHSLTHTCMAIYKSIISCSASKVHISKHYHIYMGEGLHDAIVGILS